MSIFVSLRPVGVAGTEAVGVELAKQNSYDGDQCVETPPSAIASSWQPGASARKASPYIRLSELGTAVEPVDQVVEVNHIGGHTCHWACVASRAVERAWHSSAVRSSVAACVQNAAMVK